MSDASEFGECDICGKEAVVTRKYYNYNIKCDCCLSGGKPMHFHIVRHCADCTPKPPEYIRPKLLGSDFILLEETEKNHA